MRNFFTRRNVFKVEVSVIPRQVPFGLIRKKRRLWKARVPSGTSSMTSLSRSFPTSS